MRIDSACLRWLRPAILPSVLLVLMAALPLTAASWKRGNDFIAWQADDKTLWQFSFGTNQGKPFFHPLCVTGGDSLTAFKPTDHPWHYGLWFSWKYINGINYWEEDKKTGHAEGFTTWDAPNIATHEDGSAEIQMTLRYVSPTNGVAMTEQRKMNVSAPATDGGVIIDWVAKFTAGEQPLLLDRTHMPGEEHGAVNGGYAGLSLRAAQAPATCEFVSCEGPITKFEHDRARPGTKAAACNVTRNGRTDGVAILSHVSNTGGDSTWYLINSAAMRWFSPALLAPAPRKMAPRDSFTWKFRIITVSGAWTPEKLGDASAEYNK